MRGISEGFVQDLKFGDLSFFLERVKEDREKFSLEIRDKNVNIYYCGGSILKIYEKKYGYRFKFDANYCLNKGCDINFEKLKNLSPCSVGSYIDNFNLMKSEMDSWFEANPKKERKFQQKLLQDVSIIDIEYQIHRKKLKDGKGMRLDMIMVKDGKLIIIENKYGQGALSGNAGIAQHYADINRLFSNETVFEEFLESMKNIINIKSVLGLLGNKSDYLLEQANYFSKNNTEVLFLLVNYNPKSSKLRNAINEIKELNTSEVFKSKIYFLDENENQSIKELDCIEYSKAKDLFKYEC